MPSTFWFSLAPTKILLAQYRCMHNKHKPCLDFLTHAFNSLFYLTFLSFKIVSDWKLSLARLLRIINFTCPPDHQTSIFTCLRQNLFPLGNHTCVFSCPGLEWDFKKNDYNHSCPNVFHSIQILIFLFHVYSLAFFTI